MTGPVIAAVDLGPLTGRVLYHAAAFARLLQVPLKVLHVNGDRSDGLRDRVMRECLQLGPYQEDFDDSQIVVRAGRVSEAIAREAVADKATLIVIGSRAQSGVSKLLLGSTSESVLKSATTPVLLVPPIDVDIVNIDGRVALTTGPVIAAVDLAEDSTGQLQLAGRLAEIGRQPLLLMTVARSRVSDHDASQQLRERAHLMQARKPTALIVRRGAVAEEISRCAVVEGAGLVVMGLRASPSCRPGVIASAVLRTRRAFVLAVPGARAVIGSRAGTRRAAMIATLLFALGAVGVSAQQRDFRDANAVAAFQRAADSYAFVHRQAERQLGLSHRAAGQPAVPIEAAELAAAIRAARAPAPGNLFTGAVVGEFRALASRAVHQGCDAGVMRTGTWEMSHTANTGADGTTSIAACLSSALPALPPELEYRSAGTVLLVVDAHANLVVDVLPALLAGSDLR